SGPGSGQERKIKAYGRAAYLSLPGTVGNYASTPDRAALRLTDDFDLIVKAFLTDWDYAGSGQVLMSRAVTAGNQSFIWRINVETGLPAFYATDDGTNT